MEANWVKWTSRSTMDLCGIYLRIAYATRKPKWWMMMMQYYIIQTWRALRFGIICTSFHCLSTSVINYLVSLIHLSGRQTALWQGKQNEINVSISRANGHRTRWQKRTYYSTSTMWIDYVTAAFIDGNFGCQIGRCLLLTSSAFIDVIGHR